MKKLKATLSLTLLIAAAAVGLPPAWLHAKAGLAQQLLQQSWQHTAQGDVVKPWPWADTHAIARLWLHKDAEPLIVLEGDSGRTLAFGPGWTPASAAPNSDGTSIISAHRDTHFAPLKDLQPGDVIQLQSSDQTHTRYHIQSTAVVDSNKHQIGRSQSTQLVLVTCWPFDSDDVGGSLRYVVTATPATHDEHALASRSP